MHLPVFIAPKLINKIRADTETIAFAGAKSRHGWAFATCLETCEWLVVPFNAIQSLYPNAACIFTYMSPWMWAFFTQCTVCHLCFFPWVLAGASLLGIRDTLLQSRASFPPTALEHCVMTVLNGKVIPKDTYLQTNCPNDSGTTKILFKHFPGPWNHMKKLQGGSSLFFVENEGRFQIVQDLLESLFIKPWR